MLKLALSRKMLSISWQLLNFTDKYLITAFRGTKMHLLLYKEITKL